jgi:SnoaL-like polyketide cyclase
MAQTMETACRVKVGQWEQGAHMCRTLLRPRRQRRVRRLIEEACNRGPVGPPRDAGVAAAGGAPLARLPGLLAAFRAAVPDARRTIEEQVVQNQTVVTRLSVSGTFSGNALGLAPPGRPAAVTEVAISRFVAGRLAGLWLQADLLDLLQQLGVMPPLDLSRAVAIARVQRAGALLLRDEVESPARRRPHGELRYWEGGDDDEDATGTGGLGPGAWRGSAGFGPPDLRSRGAGRRLHLRAPAE